MHIRRVIEVGRFDGWWNFGCHHSHNGWPCGKCIACRKKWSNDWVVRLNEEKKHSVSTHFFTLTYNDYFVPHIDQYEYDVYDHSNNYVGKYQSKFTPDYPTTLVCSRTDIQKMLKRLRRIYSKKDISLRYFIVSEYGPRTLRPHYHGIIFFDKYVDERTFWDSLLDVWTCPNTGAPYGNIETSLVTGGRISYVAKYSTTVTMLPEYLQVKEYKPFMLCSRGTRGNCGIGMQYCHDEKNLHYHRTTTDRKYSLKNEDNNKCYSYSLPRVYYYKMFDRLERKLLECKRYCMNYRQDRVKDQQRKDNYESLGNTNVFSREPLDPILKNDYYICLIEDAEKQAITKNKRKKL